jgi:hypothetical protein
MLYVPLFFYIFDGLAERSAKKKEKLASSEVSPDATLNDSLPGGMSPNTEGDH